mgnify:CR=1 FL=1
MYKHFPKLESADKRYLAEHGVRPLSHRVAVYRYLVDHPTHPTADDIYTDLKQTMASISRTTVYNVLNLLCDQNLVRRIPIENTEMRYDANTADHIHFKCYQCGSVHDLHDVSFPTVDVPKGFSTREVHVNIVGLCPSCSDEL